MITRQNGIPSVLTANGSSKQILAFSGSVDISASADESEPMKKKFSMDLYNGGPMMFAWSEVPVYVDLQGMDLVQERPSPIYLNHQSSQIVGHSTNKQIINGALHVEGVISGAGEAAREVRDAAANGFPWQASQGTSILATKRIKAGDQYSVNGRIIAGPALIVTKSRLNEGSFVPLGADDTTTVAMVAAMNPMDNKESDMSFEDWLKAQGFTLSELSDQQKVSLQAAYDAEMNAGAGDGSDADDDDGTADHIAQLRAEMAAETARINAIRKVCAGKHGDIEAKAISEGWTSEKAELEALRASRAKAPGIIAGASSVAGTEILEAALMQAAGVMTKDEEDRIGDKVLQAAHSRYHHRLGLQDFIMEAARSNGFDGVSFKADPRGALRAAFGLQGAFSAVNVAGILSNIQNKQLLAGFNSVDQAWRSISSVASVNDFKVHTRYRMTGANKYEKVGPGGEIKHGALGELSYTNQAETYALMLAITRQDMINDDLNALAGAPRSLGRGAALKLNELFWTVFLNNSAFFASGNSNYISGASTALSIDSLTAAEQKFMDQTDPGGKPVAIMPRVLLVPTSLSTTAAQLMNSTELRDTTASTKYGVANPHAGKFSVVTTPYLNNASISGYSTTAWYMLADPMDLPVIETAFLNGKQSPVIETAEADFNTLGIQMRGYHDFGVALQEYRGGVKSKGAA